MRRHIMFMTGKFHIVKMANTPQIDTKILCSAILEDKNIDQWNRIESPDINPYIYCQLIFTKGAQGKAMGNEQSFQEMVLGQLDIHIQKNKFRPLCHIKYQN